MAPLILRLNIAGQPVKWVPWQEAICLYSRDMIAWTAGDSVFSFRGGTNRISGQRSHIEINSIVAIKRSVVRKKIQRDFPPLTNRELFRRDAHLCMYCGGNFHESNLTRDHVHPLSRGGKDKWSNVVTACKSCNSRKGNRRPEESKMPLLAIPYVPNWAEYLALSNRKILADQMEFLKSQFSKRPMPFYNN
ncbi:MAG: HNH endonuclease [Proteobacteria bacterium]|nr:HNH endonuclease [Pseudomonadota bacterium]